MLFASVLLAVAVLADGTANYAKGSALVVAYLFVGAGFWLHKDPLLSEPVDAGGAP